MARYPTFDEYAKRGAYNEGVTRCTELLQRNPKDVNLLIVKLQLLAASNQKIDETLEQLVAIQPPIQDLRELVPIEAAVVDANENEWPAPTSAGPQVSKLWENAFKANTSTNYRLDLLTTRFARAVIDNRIQDIQQSLISLKTVQPKNRSIYMAHAAYTELLSKSLDDLQARLALGLAKKAVTEKFDDEATLDCRVAGQIFARHNAKADLEAIRERPGFRESKQVYEALGLSEKVDAASNQDPTGVDPSKVSANVWLSSEIEGLCHNLRNFVDKKASSELLMGLVTTSVRCFKLAIDSLDSPVRAADACLVAVSALVKLYADSKDSALLWIAGNLSERLLKHHKYNYEARVLLIYIYMRLNLGSLAIQHFNSLNVKEVQYDTIGHSLFTHLSTVHPWKTELVDSAWVDWFEPYERTVKALHIYPRHEDKLADTESDVLTNGQTGMIFDLQDLRQKLRTSLTKRKLILEQRRIARLTGKQVHKNISDIGPKRVANWCRVEDNRDFNATTDRGFAVERALCPDNDTTAALFLIFSDLCADTAWSLAKDTPGPLIISPEDLLSDIVQSSPHTPVARVSAHAIVIQLLKVLLDVQKGTSPSKEVITSLQEAVQTLNIDLLVTATPESLAKFLDHHYLYIDTLRIVSATCAFVKKRAEHIPMEVATLQATAQKSIGALQKHAREQSDSLKARLVMDALLNHQTLSPVVKQLDEVDLSAFAEKLVKSAKEGWSGVCEIKEAQSP